MTFSLEYLKWDKSSSAFGTAAFWIAFAVGRLLGIFVVVFCRNTTMLTSYLLLLTVGLIGFLVSATFFYNSLIWVFTVVQGFALSVIFPAVFSWTSDEILSVTGKVSGMFLTVSYLAGMGFPLLIGFMMEAFNKMWFVYILVIVMAIKLIVYILMRVLLAANSKNRNKPDIVDKVRE